MISDLLQQVATLWPYLQMTERYTWAKQVAEALDLDDWTEAVDRIQAELVLRALDDQ